MFYLFHVGMKLPKRNQTQITWADFEYCVVILGTGKVLLFLVFLGQ